MASRTTRSAQIARLDPKVNRILYVRNLPFKITAEELYEIFGRYGALRQVRVGAEKDNRGTAFVVYEDIFDAKTACEHLSGFNVGTRYLTVLYFQASKVAKVVSQLELKEKYLNCNYGTRFPLSHFRLFAGAPSHTRRPDLSRRRDSLVCVSEREREAGRGRAVHRFQIFSLISVN